MKDLQLVAIIIGSYWAICALILVVTFAREIIRLNKDNWVTVYLGILLGFITFVKVYDALTPVVSADLNRVAQIVVVSSSSIIVGVIPLIALASIELYKSEFRSHRSLLKNRFEL